MRGDVYRLRAPRDGRGHEHTGRHYAVAIQSDLLPLSTLLVAPTSTNALPTLFRPAVEVEGTRTLVLVEQTVAVDPGRLGDRIGRLSATDQAAVDQTLRVVFGLI